MKYTHQEASLKTLKRSSLIDHCIMTMGKVGRAALAVNTHPEVNRKRAVSSEIEARVIRHYQTITPSKLEPLTDFCRNELRRS